MKQQAASSSSIETSEEVNMEETKVDEKSPIVERVDIMKPEAKVDIITAKQDMKTELHEKLKSRISVDKPSARFSNGGSGRRKNKHKV